MQFLEFVFHGPLYEEEGRGALLILLRLLIILNLPIKCGKKIKKTKRLVEMMLEESRNNLLLIKKVIDKDQMLTLEIQRAA